MQQNDVQTALEILIKIKENLTESMVEELIRYKDDDASSFNLQEIEDRFSIRIANLNTLLATLQEYQNPFETALATRIVTNVYEIAKNKLASKLDEVLEFIPPDDVLNLSIVPSQGNKYLIIISTAQ